jgi:hypothetical protein
VQPYLQVGATLNEMPQRDEVDPGAVAIVGMEFAAGRFRPGFSITAAWTHYPAFWGDATQILVGLNLGYVAD